MHTPNSFAKLLGRLRKHYRLVLLLIGFLLFIWILLPPTINSNFKLVKAGMHRSEVIRLLGEPRNLSMYECERPIRFASGGGEALDYHKEEIWVTNTACYSVFYDKTDHVLAVGTEQPLLIDNGLILNVYGYFKRKFQKVDGSHTFLMEHMDKKVK